MQRRLLLGLLLSAPAGPLRAADLVDGFAAYDGGDYVEAARIWRELAAAGDTAAMVALAGLCEQGLGVPRDPARARELYERAAARGDPTARRILERAR